MLTRSGSSSSADKNIHFGHTPDPDDAYMFYGLAKGLVSLPGYKIKHVMADIETLNQKAMRASIELTAISTAVFPLLKNNYWILPVGASVGRNYGPVLVKKKGHQPKGFKTAIPGKHTSAYLLLRLYGGAIDPVEVPFDKIPEAVLSGKVDFGLFIHEAQLTYADIGFEKIIDLGEAWMKDTQLPIPLGLDIVRKDLGRSLALKVGQVLKESILIANKNREAAIQYALEFGRGLQTTLGNRFVDMYVNKDTLDLGEEGERALHVLFDKAYQRGFVSNVVDIEILRP